MNRDAVGINEDKINSLVLDIYDYIEKINAILSNIDNEMEKTSTCFKFKTGDSLRKKYSDLRANYSIINKNLMGYTEKLIKVKSKTNEFSKDLKTQIVSEANNIQI